MELLRGIGMKVDFGINCTMEWEFIEHSMNTIKGNLKIIAKLEKEFKRIIVMVHCMKGISKMKGNMAKVLNTYQTVILLSKPGMKENLSKVENTMLWGNTLEGEHDIS